jgi:predicted NBD/HSP70 family sugar kinase
VIDPTGKPCACGARGCLETLVGADAGAAPDQLADALAAALRTVVHLFDPEAIVLGGTLAALGETFAQRVGDTLAAVTLGAHWHTCTVRRSLLGADAALVGAATAALDTVLSDPTIVPLS